MHTNRSSTRYVRSVKYIRATDKAYLVSDLNSDILIWLPMSQIKLISYNAETKILELEIPEWLLEEKGLL